MMQSCAIVDFCWPTVGRGCGAITNSYLWDFAGSWPMALSAGMKLRNLQTGKPLEFLDLSCFIKEKTPWKLKGYYVLSTEENFLILKNKIKKIEPVDEIAANFIVNIGE